MDMSQKVKFSDLFSFSITGQDILKLFTSQNKRGCNPLMTAAEFESNDVLQFLLNYLKGLVISKGIFNLFGSIHGKYRRWKGSIVEITCCSCSEQKGHQFFIGGST